MLHTPLVLLLHYYHYCFDNDCCYYDHYCYCCHYCFDNNYYCYSCYDYGYCCEVRESRALARCPAACVQREGARIEPLRPAALSRRFFPEMGDGSFGGPPRRTSSTARGPRAALRPR